MKILVLSDDFPPYVSGGAGVIAYRLSKEFVRQGHEVIVISSTQEVLREGVGIVEGMVVHRIYSKYHERWRSYRSAWNPKVVRQVRKIIRDVSPDVVHAHNIHAHLSYASLLVARKNAGKVYMTAHDIMSFYPGTFTEFINPKDFSSPKSFDYKVTSLMLVRKFRLRYNPLLNILIRYCLSRISKVIAVSNTLFEALSQNGIKNVEIVHNGINFSEWDIPVEQVDEFKKVQGIEGCEVVLFQGRLSGAKGGELILQAMQKVITSVPTAVLLVVGKKDGYSERMMEKARSLGIDKSIVFSGWLVEEEVRKAYVASNVVVIPSVCFDSFPNGNLEAFAARKPVVATCFGGSSEIVDDEKNGYIVNPFNIQLLSAHLIGLLTDRKKALEFGEAGYLLVVKNFSIEKIALEYIAKFQ